MERVELKKETYYLVTGAAGYLGLTVTKQLVRQGAKVRAFILTNDPARKYLPVEVEIYEGDLTQKASLEPFFRLPKGAEAYVLHIASIVTSNPDWSQKVMDVNVGGTRNIIELCLTSPGIKRMVYCSSTGAIPDQPRGTAIKEIDHFDASLVPGCYSQSKALASQAVLDACREQGLHASIVHPSAIMGPGDYARGEITQTLARIVRGELRMGLECDFNLCDVRDLAASLISAAEKGRDGECYILANKPVSFKQFSNMALGAAGGRKIRIFFPLPVVMIGVKIMERLAKLTGRKPILTTFYLINVARNNCFDATKAQKELGYHTRPYKETIADHIRWMQEEGILKQ
ncbi:MAG: NAD-dependent epimerase/dehydratase family protein [Paludibacteraceae bacterium]|nr:NAD-dependent epimerase/dehydratase family protein [Paludibacteraceae bacterium]